MSVNLFGSRRNYHEKCLYWSVDENNVDYEKLKRKKQSTGIFYAKELNDVFKTDQTDNGLVEIGTQDTMIVTEDDVYDLCDKDLVLYAGEYWIVKNIRSKRVGKNTQFMKKAKRVWYIQLGNIGE